MSSGSGTYNSGASSMGTTSPADTTGSTLANVSVGAITAVLANASSSVNSSSSSNSSSGAESSKSGHAGSSSGVPPTGWSAAPSSSFAGSFFVVSSTGWGVTSSTASGSKPGRAAESGIDRSNGLQSGKSSGGSLVGRRSQPASTGKYPAVTSGSAGQKMGAQNTSAGTSAEHTSASSKNREQSQSSEMNTRSGGVEVYSMDFPDSTKNTALLSPPDPAGTPLFSFDPTMNTEFPDLAEREFLVPTLHVGALSSGSPKKLDLYQRIQERLERYQAESETKRKGMQQGSSGARRASENPFSKNPFSNESSVKNGLEKKRSITEPSF